VILITYWSTLVHVKNFHESLTTLVRPQNDTSKRANINWYHFQQKRLLHYCSNRHFGALTDWCTFQFIKPAWLSVAYSTASVWTLTVDILNTICNRDCFADGSFNLTLIVSFCSIAFLVCHWKQIIISRSWNWTHLQFSTQCSNWCEFVLRN